MAKLYNLARMTTATTGTGTITLGSAVAGFLSFAGAGIADGEVVSYAIKDGSNSEIGRGTYTSSGTTLTRSVLKSTNSNNAISLSGTAEIFITPAAEDIVNIAHPGGRLTLTTASPILSTTTTAATTIYYTPFVHRFVPIYDGTSFTMTDVGGELSQATTDSTKSPAACTTNSNYDLFVWNDSGTYRCTRGPAWSSSTARGTGAGTTELELVRGIYLNKVAITNGPAANRGTYVGTIRTNGSSQVDWKFGSSASGGGEAFVGVWNAYNRVNVCFQVVDSAVSWTYSSATVRPWNNSTTNRVSFISGLAQDGFDVAMNGAITTAASAGAYATAGLALDATASMDVRSFVQTAAAFAVTLSPAARKGYGAQLGFHYVQAVEAGDGSTTSTFTGAVNGGLSFAWRA